MKLILPPVNLFHALSIDIDDQITRISTQIKHERRLLHIEALIRGILLFGLSFISALVYVYYTHNNQGAYLCWIIAAVIYGLINISIKPFIKTPFITKKNNLLAIQHNINTYENLLNKLNLNQNTYDIRYDNVSGEVLIDFKDSSYIVPIQYAPIITTTYTDFSPMENLCAEFKQMIKSIS